MYSHPNIIAYKDAFFEDSTQMLWIVMEYATEGDLYYKIQTHRSKGTRFTEKEIWHYFIQTVRGLKVLHDMKILHRDIKSANIYLTSDNIVKLGDMNVSKVVKNELAYTQTGTPYYASPEVWKDHPYDYKSDMWSLGCVLYEMCTLRPPFMAESMKDLYRKVAKGEYVGIPLMYSTELSNVIRKLLQVNAANRPNCNQILESAEAKVILGETLMKLEPSKEEIKGELLNTIKVPNNFKVVNLNLPKANYDMSRPRALHRKYSLHSISNRRMSTERSSITDSKPNEELKRTKQGDMQILRRDQVKKAELPKKSPLPIPKKENVKGQPPRIQLYAKVSKGGKK